MSLGFDSKSPSARSGYLKGLISGYGFTGLNIAAQVVLVPLYLRYLGKGQFGLLMMLLGYVNYASVGVNWLTGGLLRVFGTFHAANDIPGFSQVFRLGRYIYVGYALVIGLIMLSVAGINPGLLFGHDAGMPVNLLWWAIAATAVHLLFVYYLSIDRVALTAIGLQYWAYALQSVALLIYAVVAIVLLAVGTNIAVLMGVLAFGVFVSIVIAKRIWTTVPNLAPAPAKAGAVRWGDMINKILGRRAIGYFVYGAFLLTMQADVLFLGWLGGAEVAAEYVVLWKAAEVAVLMLWRIPETLIPDLIQADVNGDDRGLSASYWTAWRWTLLLSAAGGIAYAFLGSTVVGIWLGRESVPQAPYAFLLAGTALFFLGSTHPASIYAYATCRFRRLLPIAGLELLIKLTVLYLAYPTFGYLSPIIGLIVANILGIYWLYGTLAPPRLQTR